MEKFIIMCIIVSGRISGKNFDEVQKLWFSCVENLVQKFILFELR